MMTYLLLRKTSNRKKEKVGVPPLLCPQILSLHPFSFGLARANSHKATVSVYSYGTVPDRSHGPLSSLFKFRRLSLAALGPGQPALPCWRRAHLLLLLPFWALAPHSLLGDGSKRNEKTVVSALPSTNSSPTTVYGHGHSNFAFLPSC